MAEIYNTTPERKEQVNKLIKDFLAEHNTSIYRLAKLLSDKYGRSASVSNLLNKFARGSYKTSELMDIVELFDCELKIVPKQPMQMENTTNTPKI